MDTTQEAVLTALDKGHEHLFITGEAGTGKSYIVRKWLDSHPDVDKAVAICAPTGVAALNIGGQTLHRVFNIPFSITHIDEQVRQAERRMQRAKKDYLRGIETLLIDEISMVRADVLDYVYIMLQAVRENDLPWGGVRLVAVGDPFQLPPVVPKRDQERLPEPWFFQSRAWKAEPVLTLNLVKCYRQDDPEFIAMLNNIRRGRISTTDMAILAERYTKTPDPKAVIISTLNRTVDAINERELAKIKTEEHVFTMTYQNFDEKYKIEKNVPAPINLRLKIGARVMLLSNNYDENGFWVNGSLGEVTKIHVDTPYEKLQYIEVELDDGCLVKVHRNKWTSEECTLEDGFLNKRILGEAIQFPIKLGYAMTVHKSQGLTLEKMHYMADYVFECGQTYVALSRATSLEGLTVASGISSRHVMANSHVVRFMED